MRTSALLLLLLLTSGLAVAQERDEERRKGQVTVNLQVGSGYRAISPTDEEFCGSFEVSRSGFVDG